MPKRRKHHSSFLACRNIFDELSFDLRRFVTAQDEVYSDVVAELKEGRKRTHWMWFVVPQVAGLGNSPTAKHYAIQLREKAEAYFAHPILGVRLIECTRTVMTIDKSA